MTVHSNKSGRVLITGGAATPSPDDEGWMPADEATREARRLTEEMDEVMANGATKRRKPHAKSLQALSDRIWTARGKPPPVTQLKGTRIEDLADRAWERFNGKTGSAS